MKRRDLERWLRKHRAHLRRHGSSHDLWGNPHTARLATIPRHREIKPGTVKAICEQLGVPLPPR